MDAVPTLCITLIAMVSADGYISSGTGVPWDLPADKVHFRAYTSGKWLLIGLKTYGEMLGWFRDHTPLVLTRQQDFRPEIGRRVGDLSEAVRMAKESGQAELVVCGGGAAYAASIRHAHRLVITRVHENLEAGVRFPWDQMEGTWHRVSRDVHTGEPSFEIEVMERKN